MEDWGARKTGDNVDRETEIVVVVVEVVVVVVVVVDLLGSTQNIILYIGTYDVSPMSFYGPPWPTVEQML